MEKKSYSEQILEAARAGRTWRSAINNEPVPASIVDRYEADKPLNELEAEAFEFVTANLEFVESMIQFVEEARRAGHRRYSIQPVIDRARWERDMKIRSTDSRFEINDHVAPYLSRIVNECIGAGFFTTRSVEGEPGWAERRSKRTAPGRDQIERAARIREALTHA
ncbi:hypothetical protein [Ferrovibrio sp.]|uniref:hypothetical protein n=1 Tax=Ferrovibrio sp. TaxID=1917215 RepID=UPI0035B05ACF